MSWDAWSGRPTTALVAAVRSARSAGVLPGTVLVISGSNDIFDARPFAAAVDTIVRAIGPSRRVVWVTPYVSRPVAPLADLRNTALIGFALERAATRHDSLVLVPWFDFLAANPAHRLRAYVPDGVHPKTAAGTAAFVSLVARSL